MTPELTVVALGGNALIRKGERGTAAEQRANLRDTFAAIEPLLHDGPVVVTHGNGPQVGNELLRQELGAAEAPPLPLYLAVAQTQAEIGALIVSELPQVARRPAAVVLTRVAVALPLVVAAGWIAARRPAAVIGFLTILSYSLYDTTVVFDKIRENTHEDGEKSGRTFGESVNLAVNQTLVRSINTTVVAALPTGAILFIGALWLGAQTLTDISLSIFVGTIVAAYSTLFVAAPLFSLLRENEAEIRVRDARVLAAREKALTAV